MERTLTKEEIAELFSYCERRGVIYHDVQIELVDHLASLIEEHWKEQADDPYKYALYKAFKKFGPNGFMQVKEQKQKALNRKYRRILWNYLLEFYRWPKMLLTLVLSLGVFTLLQYVNQIHWLFVGYMVVIVTGAAIYDSKFKTKHKVKTISGKSFLLADQLKQIQSAAMLLCNLPVLALVTFNLLRSLDISLPNNNFILFAFALLLVSSLIVLYGYFFHIPKKIKEHFMDQFPEFAN